MKTILLIDDSWIARKGIKNILASDYRLLESDNAKKALSILKTESIDLILLDLLMPEMDGFQFLSCLKEDKISKPVIVVSADIQKTTRKKVFALGAAGFLNKPPDKIELKKLIDSLINT